MTERTDNVIILHNNAVVPEIMARCGTILLHFGYDDDRESIELEGNLTMSEVCFMKERLGAWIRKTLEDMEDDDAR